MRYLYHPQAGRERLVVDGEAYHHLFKVRRQRADATFFLRNLEDDRLYTYRTERVDRRRAELALASSEELRIGPGPELHLGWCVVDPKTVEKALPTLNELGVAKISFVRCERSQHNFRLDMERLGRILLNSSQQSGRSVMMQLQNLGSLEEFLQQEPESWLLDFCENPLPCVNDDLRTLLIGPEGGVAPEERALFPPERIVGLDTPMVLRSESAVCAAAARILL